MRHDLFISYSRRDNADGRVTELVEQIKEDYREFAGDEPSCFFDMDSISGMDDWRHRILQGLRESEILLVVLSPSYLESGYCEWEVVEYLKYEHSRAVAGQGVSAIYFAEVPGLDSREFNAQAKDWVLRLRTRHHWDLRPWHDAGKAALNRSDVRKRLSDLGKKLADRISKLRSIARAPGNLRGHNPRFVGRSAEIERLHESTALGKLGVITALQGLGGLGKTALAIQYAYAYADHFPGGRWHIGCANERSLASAIRTLEPDLGITLTEEEKKDEERGARRILAELEKRAVAGARERAGERHPPSALALIILDNVDAPGLLQPPQSDLVSGKPWLRILATTRLGETDLGSDPHRREILTVGELPLEDAVDLIERHQMNERFADDQERAAAREIARILDGFTLAVEVVAVYLGESAGQKRSCAGLLGRLQKEGLAGVEAVAGTTKGAVAHHEKLVGLTLGPTLGGLGPEETLVLNYAALLPPDAIPLPWIRSLVSRDHPQLGKSAEPGYDDPWLSLVNRLICLRLLQVADVDPDTQAPRLARLHRLVGQLVCVRMGDKVEPLRDALSLRIKERCSEFEDVWHLHKWEIPVMVEYARGLLNRQDAKAPTVLRSLCQWLPEFDDGSHSEPLLRACLAQLEAQSGDDPKDLSVTLSNLGWALRKRGRYPEAEGFLRRALEIDEKRNPTDKHALAVRYGNLGQCILAQGRIGEVKPIYEKALIYFEEALGPEHRHVASCLLELARLYWFQGQYDKALPLYERSLATSEKVLGPEHPEVATCLNNLAVLKGDQGRYDEALPLHERSLAIREKVLGPEHPDVATSLGSLAVQYWKQGQYDKALPLYERSLTIRERVLGPEHPDVAITLNNLAVLHRDQGRYNGALPLFERCLAIYERALGPEHPDVAIVLNNLAELHRKQGRYNEALPLHERCLAIREKMLGPEHLDTALCKHELAFVHDCMHEPNKALPLYRDALAVLGRTVGPDDSLFVNGTLNLQICLRNAGDPAFDVELLRACTRRLRERNDPRAKKGLDVLQEMGVAPEPM
jgi:tetratricopeptide (TPR) repeat protein